MRITSGDVCEDLTISQFPLTVLISVPVTLIVKPFSSTTKVLCFRIGTTWAIALYKSGILSVKFVYNYASFVQALCQKALKSYLLQNVVILRQSCWKNDTCM